MKSDDDLLAALVEASRRVQEAYGVAREANRPRVAEECRRAQWAINGAISMLARRSVAS